MKLSLLITAIFFSMVAFSCGNKEESAGDKKDQSKQEVKKEASQDNANIKSMSEDSDLKRKEEQNNTTGGEQNTSASELGMTPGLPSNYPNDIPKPKNATTIGSINSMEGTLVTFESSDKVSDIIEFFKDEMKRNGYAIPEGGEVVKSENGALIKWKKGDKEVELTLAFDDKKNKTSIVVTYK